MLVVAFFAAPAIAQCTGTSGPVDFNAGDISFGAWPANMNFDSVSSGEQKAFAFWNGKASNDLLVKKDQTAGSAAFQGLFPLVECDCDAADQVMMEGSPDLINIEMISSGNQFATATGYATAKNTIRVCSTQGPAVGGDY